MVISDDVTIVPFDECGDSARSFVRWRLSMSLERMVPSREAFVRTVAARAAAGLLIEHGVVRACVDAESKDVVLGCVAAFGQTIAVLAVREKYRGVGVGDALVDAVGAHSSIRALPDVTKKVEVLARSDLLWSWCVDWLEAES